VIPEPAPRRLAVTASPGALVVDLGAPHHVLGWSIIGGGERLCRHVTWLEVHDLELTPRAHPVEVARARCREAGLPDELVLLTSRRVDRFEAAGACFDGVVADCVATVGLGNALTAGDPPGPPRVGTINLLARVDAPLSMLGRLEALAIAVEARTLAVLEADVASRRSGRRASGTGTDCVVVAVPPGASSDFAGKHTATGAAVGAAVHRAVSRGARAWKAEQC
jgi:adenosylcobinamide amidohydrolase